MPFKFESKKTKIICFQRNGHIPKKIFYFGAQIVEKTASYKYLGTIVTAEVHHFHCLFRDILFAFTDILYVFYFSSYIVLRGSMKYFPCMNHQ